MTNAAEPDHGPVLHATQARQGRRGRHVLWVLLVSLALVVLALFGTWLSRSDDLEAAGANDGPVAAGGQFNAPDPAPKQTDIEVAPGVPGDTSPASPVTQTR